jgi:hypothetical protein
MSLPAPSPPSESERRFVRGAGGLLEYVATDQNGLAATSTRTVIIEAPDKWGSSPFDE